MNKQSTSFHDVSALSGLDSDKDGRGFALLDYDRDGWQDIVIVNANSPQLEIYKNNIGEKHLGKHSVSFRLIGGNHTAKPNSKWSNRNSFGAVIKVSAGGKQYMRELRCGEGFAVQNSGIIHIGIGDNKKIDSVEINWPSGKKQTVEGARPGTIITVREMADTSVTSYKRSLAPKIPTPSPKGKLIIPGISRDKPTVFVTTATWCPSCKKYLSQVALLKEQYGDQFRFIGLPVDPNDSAQALSEYVQQYKPAYEMLTAFSTKNRASISNVLKHMLGNEVLPSTIITNTEGEIIAAQKGIPTISTLSKITRLLKD